MSPQHAVFAFTADERRVRVSNWLPEYATALGCWSASDARPHPDVRWYAVRSSDDPDWCESPADFALAFPPPEPEPPRPIGPQPGDRGNFGKRHWKKLPPVHGFSRVEDEWHPQTDRRGNPKRYGAGIGGGSMSVPQYRRMVRCDLCGEEIPSLGVGYHQQGGKKCSDRAEARKKEEGR